MKTNLQVGLCNTSQFCSFHLTRNHLPRPWSTMRVSVQRLPVCGQVLPLSFVQFVSTGASLLRLNLIMRCMFVDAFDAFFVETCLGVWCFPSYICVFKVRSESGPSSASKAESTCATFRTGGISLRFGLKAWIRQRCRSAFFLLRWLSQSASVSEKTTCHV